MSENQDTHEIEQIVADVLQSRKYGNVCVDTVHRLAAEEWSKRRSSRRALKEATKATRSRLHQAYGAYESPVDYERAYQDLESAYVARGPEAAQAVCRRLLTLHASTRERLPILDRLYGEVFAHTGVPEVLLDLACGLNPLSLPWMGLGAGAAYYAYDIDGARIGFINRCFALWGLAGVPQGAGVPARAGAARLARVLGMPGRAGVPDTEGVPDLIRVEGRAFFQDLLSHPPEEPGDVALLFKSSACLERQRAGATLALLDALHVRHVVVTFPVHSLGRRKRDMPEHYERTFREMVSDRPWPVTLLRFETELVFLVDKG